jgi:hypothetical protein
MHKPYVRPRDSRTHNSTNYRKYHHSVSYIMFNTTLSLIQHKQKNKRYLSNVVAPTQGRSTGRLKPRNLLGNPHTNCHLLPIRDFYPKMKNEQA